jgi:Mg2+ and Co2+ transporter CorA
MLNFITYNEAKYSAAIAEDSKMDNTSMRTIALLTMIFLPGTFVATLFSMTIIDWAPGEGVQPRFSP